jgi:hypothetical protein
MITDPTTPEDESRKALTRSLLAAAVQGVIRAILDAVLGRWGRGLL